MLQNASMRVISASRRTDIPAFYTPWLLNRLEEGYCEWMNPFSGQMSRVSLLAEECVALVLWTRHPAPLLPHLPGLREDGYHCCAHVTLTGYPRTLEPHAPPVEVAVRNFHALSECLGADFVQWRYDPILLSREITAAYHRARFAHLARELAGATTRCLISFVNWYGKTARHLQQVAGEGGWYDPGPDERRALAVSLSGIAVEYGIGLYACCNPELIGEGIQQAHCVDADLLRRLRPDLALRLRTLPTRAGCGCAASTDIGAYDTCTFGCAYCYATNSFPTARTRQRAHDPHATSLWAGRHHGTTGV